MNDCKKKRALNVGRARMMVYDRNEWRGFVRGNALDTARVMNPRHLGVEVRQWPSL